MKWSVPLTFKMGCRVIVEGDNPHEAMRNAVRDYNDPMTQTQCNPEYVMDSVHLAYGAETIMDVYPAQ